MLKIRCVKKCYYKGRVFKPGDMTTIAFDGVFSEECFQYLNRKPPTLSLPKCSGPVTLLGNGPSLKYALDNHDRIITPVAAVNIQSGVGWPGKLDYWLTLHTEKLALWKRYREKAGMDMDGIQFISDKSPLNPAVIRSQDYMRSGGGSGLYAAETLALMGFDHIHIYGIDLTDGYKHFRFAWKPENFKIKVTVHCGFLKELFNKE